MHISASLPKIHSDMHALLQSAQNDRFEDMTLLDQAPGVRIVVASPIFPEKEHRGRKETTRVVLFTVSAP